VFDQDGASHVEGKFRSEKSANSHRLVAADCLLGRNDEMPDCISGPRGSGVALPIANVGFVAAQNFNLLVLVAMQKVPAERADSAGRNAQPLDNHSAPLRWRFARS
jgi:hypothetical protein